MVSLLLGERHRQPGCGTDILTLSDVDKPSLMEHALGGQSFEPRCVHEGRNIITGE
jgi:hypothetical protein